VLAACQCGATKEIDAAHMRYGRIRSCGCLAEETSREVGAKHLKRDGNPTHGMSKTPVYAVWKSMHQRCTNPNSPDYRWYGALGVGVCEEWKSFEAFYADMGEPNGLTLERRDPFQGYAPGNCHWATWEEQRKNKRANRAPAEQLET